MYGVGVYKYQQPIYSQPQLPTANYRLKPPGLGCASCGGMGATDSNLVPGLLVTLGIVVGAYFLFSKGSKRASTRRTSQASNDQWLSSASGDQWYRIFHNVGSKAAADGIADQNSWMSKTRVRKESNGTWTVLAWGDPNEVVGSVNYHGRKN